MGRGRVAVARRVIRDTAVDNIVSLEAIVAGGISASTAYRWCEADGPWTLMAPTTVRLGTGTATRRELVRAALVYAGERAVVTGLDAARAHGLRRGELPPEVHLLIPAGVRVRETPEIRVERTVRLSPVRVRDGLPCTAIERCVLDATRRMTDRSEVAAVLTEPVQRRLVLPERLVQELDVGSRRGSALPREILQAIRVGVRSAAELDFRDWWIAHPDLPWHVVFNVRVSDDTGLLGIADAFLPDLGLVLPVDSTEQHFMTEGQVRETERQHRAYRSAGLHVAGVRPSRIRGDGAGLHRDVLDAIRVAAALPTPRVHWTFDLPRAA